MYNINIAGKYREYKIWFRIIHLRKTSIFVSKTAYSEKNLEANTTRATAGLLKYYGLSLVWY